jgi:ribosomal protein L11 methyltransferase
MTGKTVETKISPSLRRGFFMKKYIEFVFTSPGQEVVDMLIASLSEMGFYGFLEEEGSLMAYILPDDLDRKKVEDLASGYGLGYQVNEIREENWNAGWESSFQPVRLGDFAAVRADFHAPVEDVEYEIIITPKMSFGTGHHATTWLMMKSMKDFMHPGMDVLDFGTGTGLLAILAEKMGAKAVLAIDNDSWSIDNAGENLARNGSSRVELRLADSVPGGMTFDLVLANINKHILLGHCKEICGAVRYGGTLVLSGILPSDVADIERAFDLYMGQPVRVEESNNWSLMAFTKRFAA